MFPPILAVLFPVDSFGAGLLLSRTIALCFSWSARRVTFTLLAFLSATWLPGLAVNPAFSAVSTEPLL